MDLKFGKSGYNLLLRSLLRGLIDNRKKVEKWYAQNRRFSRRRIY